MRTRPCIYSSSIIAHPVNFGTQRERSQNMLPRTIDTYIYIYIHWYNPLHNRYEFCVLVGDKPCSYIILCWPGMTYCDNMLAFPLPDYRKDHVGYHLHLKNGSFKFEVDPDQFNPILHHFSQLSSNPKKKKKKKRTLSMQRSKKYRARRCRYCRAGVPWLAMELFDFQKSLQVCAWMMK